MPWDTAQAAFLDLSGTVAGSVAAELESRKLPNTTLVAPLRPMNNIAAPAIAIEIAPPDDKVDNIASAEYQEQVAQSIAAGSCRRALQAAGGAAVTRRLLIMFAALALVAIALGFYALHLKRKVARDEQAAAEQQMAIAPPGNGPPEPVTLYIATDSDGTLAQDAGQRSFAGRAQRA